MKSFLVTSSGTFSGIISADNASRTFESQRNAERQWYENREQYIREQELQGMSFVDRAVALARREKYKIVGATWVASMIGSFALVGRNPYLSGQQKLVQARVYAQGLTLAVLVASAGFEISDQKKGKGILDSSGKVGAAAGAAPSGKKNAASAGGAGGGTPSEEGGDLWKDMVAAEEQRLKQKHQSVYEQAHAEQPENGSKKEEKKDEGEKKGEGEKKQE